MKINISGIFIFLLASYLQTADSVCSKPTLPSNGYTLTSSKASYSTGDNYEIYCLPEYTINGNSNLTCQSSGSWTPDVPSCSPAEGSYPWWLLLILVITLLILVPCILPRIIFCCCCKEKKEDEKPLHDDSYSDDEEEIPKYHGDVKDNSIWRAGKQKVNTPLTDYGKHKLTNMDIMQMYYGNVNERAVKNSQF